MSSNEPTIRMMCPNLGCQRVLGVPVHARGKLVRCRECGSMVRVPALKTQPAAPSAATAAPGGAAAPPATEGEAAAAKPAA